MRRKRAGAVRLSDHAYERWKLRVAPAKRASVADRIRRRIAAELKLGAETNRNGALEVEIRRGIWAICYPSFMGGWVVATIIREGWEEDMEEKARYGNVSTDKDWISEMEGFLLWISREQRKCIPTGPCGQDHLTTSGRRAVLRKYPNFQAAWEKFQKRIMAEEAKSL